MAPWNASITLTARAISMPLMCGNTVVFKTSELSPRSQAICIEAFIEVNLINLSWLPASKLHLQAGIPKGVLNMIHTSREVTPARTSQIIRHPSIRKINVGSVL